MARQSSAKASTPVRIWSEPLFSSLSLWRGNFFTMVLKILHWVGLLACITLIISCWLPWTYYADDHILNEADRTFTGFYSFQNNYGKPGKMLVFTGVFSILLIILPKIWAKRTNLFVCALGVGYSIKTYILYVSCYNAYCPDKKWGIYLMLYSTIAMLIASAFPNLALKETGTTKKDGLVS